MKKTFVAASIAVLIALGGCATQNEASGPFDPAACYERDFNVYFEGQDTEVSPEARVVIDAMGEALRGCRIDSVRIIGQADAAGSEIVNEEIAGRRAGEIAEYLSRRVGWPRSRMELLDTGERGAVTEDGLNVPMRRRARITVHASAPS